MFQTKTHDGRKKTKMNRHLTRISRIAILASITLGLSLPAAIAGSTWQIDPQHSSAQFAVRHLGLSTVRGAFSKLSGTVLLDDQDISKSSVEVTIDVNTVDTREPDRDKDLRSDHFFDVAHFPTMIFKSKRVEQAAPGKLRVTGDLTIHGTTKEVVLDVDGLTAPVKDPWGNQRVAATATTKINRQDYGVKWNAKLDNGGVVVGDDVNITIDVELIQKASAKSGD
ncbi:MAG TPA: YceI family protein [Candidatus Acidoferrum sp.]|nr:YceI family protein [Candidatus Acidoferrum sp.]